MSTNKNKKPTKTDREILDWMQKGNSINHIEALNLFHTIGLRDSIYRLRQDGNVIYGETVYYEPGTNKHYEKYFMPRTLANTKPISEIAQAMQETIKVVQSEIFK